MYNNNINNTVNWLKNRLQLPLPGKVGQRRMIGSVLRIPDEVPETAIHSAVMCMLFLKYNELHVLLIKRKEDGRAHSGQISFPGGRKDISDIDLKFTAFRETEEEVGIKKEEINILGALTPVYIPVSNFHVFPYVGFHEGMPVYDLNNQEVASVIEVPLKKLWHSERKIVTDVVSPAVKHVIPNVNAYKLEDGTIIWGATAMILSELETIIEEFV